MLKAEFTLDQIGLDDPRDRTPIDDGWRGLFPHADSLRKQLRIPGRNQEDKPMETKIVTVEAGHQLVATDRAQEQNPGWLVFSSKEIRYGVWEVTLMRNQG
jgi:hypothetical protein